MLYLHLKTPAQQIGPQIAYVPDICARHRVKVNCTEAFTKLLFSPCDIQFTLRDVDLSLWFPIVKSDLDGHLGVRKRP